MELDRDIVHSADFSVVAGIGVAWEIAPTWVVSLEARYGMGLSNALPELDRDTQNRALLVSVGVDFTLVHGDNDSDRIADYQDQCLTEQGAYGSREDWNGYEDGDGCPDGHKDPDNDGIAISDDQCPDEPENKNGYQDDDGCPDDDDIDKDGIAFEADRCPNEAFRFNRDLSFADAPERLKNTLPGCSPELALAKVRGDRLIIEPPLEFEFGTHEVTPEHRAALAEVMLLLRWYYPEMNLRVEGHSDIPIRKGGGGQRGRRENVNISSKRAESITAFLIEQDGSGQITEERLIPIGRGDQEPIDRETNEGSRKNRRVEFVIIELAPGVPPTSVAPAGR